MKISEQRQQRKCLSGRHAAIVDIDTIVAYLIFITIIVFLINYIIGLTAPFSTSIEALEKEESTITVKDLVNTEFGIDELNNACNIDYVNMRRFLLTYEIKGFRMPFTDAGNFSPASINGSVVFVREGNALHVMTGSQATPKIITVEVTLSQGASVTNVSLESGDAFDLRYDEFSNFIVTLDSSVSNGDIDEIIIKPVNGLATFNVYDIDLSSTYIGTLQASNSCGTRGIIGKHTSFNKYGSISDERTSYPVKLTGDIWWTG